MLTLVKAIVGALVASLRSKASLVLENLALRQQLAVLHRATPRPRLRPVDRAFWAVLSRAWSRWADTLVIVKPATVVAWHRRGSARFWARKSRRRGRPPLDAEIVALVERMAGENPLWSRRRIASEPAKLGDNVDKDTVAKYMPKPGRRPRQPPSTTWRAYAVQGVAMSDSITPHLYDPFITPGARYSFGGNIKQPREPPRVRRRRDTTICTRQPQAERDTNEGHSGPSERPRRRCPFARAAVRETAQPVAFVLPRAA